MAVVTKIKSKVTPVKKTERLDQPQVTEEEVLELSSDKGSLVKKAATKTKRCYFCYSKTEPAYWDSVNLRRYVNDRGRIVPKGRTGACAKHQRRVSKQVKYARHLSLLPFLVRV